MPMATVAMLLRSNTRAMLPLTPMLPQPTSPPLTMHLHPIMPHLLTMPKKPTHVTYSKDIYWISHCNNSVIYNLRCEINVEHPKANILWDFSKYVLDYSELIWSDDRSMGLCKKSKGKNLVGSRLAIFCFNSIFHLWLIITYRGFHWLCEELFYAHGTNW